MRLVSTFLFWTSNLAWLHAIGSTPYGTLDTAPPPKVPRWVSRLPSNVGGAHE